jgi:hypothetical protein
MEQTPKQNLSFLSLSTLLALFSLACIVNFTDPYKSGWLTFTFFYISIFLVSLGLLTIIGLIIRQWLSPNLYIVNLSHSFRQALLISILVVASFALQAEHLLYWWVEGSLILCLIFLEVFLNLKV